MKHVQGNSPCLPNKSSITRSWDMRREVEEAAKASPAATRSKIAGEASPLVSGSDIVASQGRAHEGPPARFIPR